MQSPTMLIAFLCGVLPALLWLAFWLLEDKKNPEPKRFIFLTFLAGMTTIPVVLALEHVIQDQATAAGFPKEGIIVLLLWASIEELFKFGAAYFAALRWNVFDEPVDAIIYMITAALGFAALENALFLATPIEQGQVLQTIITGDLRFVGATLLHILSSATVGLVIAYAFYKPAATRRVAAGIGVILAAALHTIFNFFILTKGGGATFLVFLTLWLGIVALLLFIERVKRPTYKYN